jgi:hypothetical protein
MQLNVRAGPGEVYPPFTQVTEGTVLGAIARTADCGWVRVATPSGRLGWVRAEYVLLLKACATLPVERQVPPVPAPIEAAPAPPTSVDAAVQAASVAAAAAPPAVNRTCPTSSTESYGSLIIEGAPTDRPAVEHPDLHLDLRGYQPSTAEAALRDFGPNGDGQAPRLTGLFGDRRQPAVRSVHQAFDWDWACNCRGPLLADPAVSVIGLTLGPDEPLLTPPSGRTLGNGYEALVLYADADSLTLKYTREDNVIHGYTLHVETLCVDPALLALYQTLNAAGRSQLPALRGGQPFGRAAGEQVLIAIRDNGTFLEARHYHNWWQ